MRDKKIDVVHVTSFSGSLDFLHGQIGYLQEKGFNVHAVSSPAKYLDHVGARENIPVYGIEFQRTISPITDIYSLIKMVRLLRELKPAIVHAHTPKAGLLGVLAARLARVPVVIYGMRGLPFETAEGLKRLILFSSETISCRLAHRVIAVSFKLRQRAIAMKFCHPAKIRVMAQGSGNGVDARGRFNPEKLPVGIRNAIRESYQIPAQAMVLGFVGRLVKDKGIVELAQAWDTLRSQFPHLYLLLVGPIELQDPVPVAILEKLKNDPRVKFTGKMKNIADFYATMDILTLPTYREGFPNTPLEAAAMELPVVATTIDGCVEAVVENETGLLVSPRDSQALTEAIEKLILNPELRKTMGEAGRQRVLTRFKPEKIWQEIYQNYLELLELKRALPQ
jgi:glycosyltransferase involved in cell wall biosynthesis